MVLKDVLEYWKIILGIVALTASIVWGAISYAEEQKALLRAEQHLIHSSLYQESRILRKEDRIRENHRELETIREFLTDDDESDEKLQKRIDFILAENTRLESEIEEIRVQLKSK